MTRPIRTLRWSAPAALVAAIASVAGAQGEASAATRASGGAPSEDATRMGSPSAIPQGATRETMWPAPTAEDWAMPCLIRWQRTFEDAEKVARASGMPILVCVNMDGEIASEHYAGIRYRRPDTARLYDPYVCVIASVYRHTPRDHDEKGIRVPCPRFGTVTCGEHIAIEPLLYDAYFGGKRIAPRHIMIEPGQKPVYDVYFAWDTDTIFRALREGVANRPSPPVVVREDRPVVERVGSADVQDRAAVETAYREGSREVRRALLEAAYAHRDLDEVDLLRQAIFGFDVELARMARKALARCESEAAVDLIAEALKSSLDPAEREALIAAAVRLGEKYPRARTLASVHQGLTRTSEAVDVERWSRAIRDGDASASARASYEVAARLETRIVSSEERPEDAGTRLELAEAFLARAQEPTLEPRFARLMLQDSRKAALEAERLGTRGWRLDAVLALVASASGDHAEALRRAEAAIAGGMPPPAAESDGAHGRNAVELLALFAEARQRAIATAYRQKATWPATWLADIDAAYAVIASHPLGTDAHVASHYDFLAWLGATPRAADVLRAGLSRHPESAILHDRLRSKLLWEKGPDGLESAYEARLAEEEAPRNLAWFAGYASLVAAEHHRRSQEPEKAKAAYDRGVAHYERAALRNPELRDGADHYVSLALAGRARIALEQGDLEEATRSILAAFARRPASAASPDGLNHSPADTAKMLRSRLSAAKREDLAARLQAGLDALDPQLLELPAYEREVPGSEGGTRPPARRTARGN